MKRRLFNLLAAVSLVMCLTSAIFWARGHRHTESIVWIRKTATWTVLSTKGEFMLGRASHPSRGFNREYARVRSIPASPLPLDLGSTRWNRLGFVFDSRHRAGGYDSWGFGIPCWLPTAVTLPASLVLGWKNARPAMRRRLGLCPRCGYDLRATPDRCPECGSAVTPTT